MSIEETINDYVQQQFQAFQLAEVDDGSEIAASSRMAANIEKHVHVIALNDAMKNVGLDQGRSESSLDVSTFLVPLLVKYVDASVTMETDASTKVVVLRVFHLVSALACSLSAKGEEAIHAVADRAQTFSNVLSDKLRSQACTLLGCMASHLIASTMRGKKKNIERTYLKESISEIEKILLSRLTDKSQSVRLKAIQAAGMIFGVSNATSEDSPNLALVEGLLWSMWHDPSVANRVEAIEAVPIDSAETLDHVIARIRDVKEKVRNAAVNALRTKVDPKRKEIMTEEHFRDIVRSGLTERCESTKTATITLICTKWTKAAKFCPVELMRLMGATVYEEECEKALKVVLKIARTKDNAILQELSDPEVRSLCHNIDKSMIRLQDPNIVFDEFQLFYTRVACSAAKESSDLTFSEKEDMMAKTAPDIPTLCDLFKKHLDRFVESIQEEDEECIDQECFVCLQLLQLAKIAGLQEEGSRRHFSAVMSNTLANTQTPDELVEDCVEAFRATFDSQDDFFSAVSVLLATLTSSDHSEDSEDKAHARMLFIFSVVLEHASPEHSDHDLFGVMEKIILSAVGSSSNAIREVAIGCLGKLGLFLDSTNVVSEFKPILLKIAANKDEATRCRGQALLVLSDLALVFSDILKPCHDSELGENLSFSLVVREMMAHANATLATIAAEVATKLLFSMDSIDYSLLPPLLVSYLDPNNSQEHDDSTDQDTDIKDIGSSARLQQLLSLFFPAFCLKSNNCREKLLGSIENSLSLAVDHVPRKKGKSRSAAFPLLKIVEYIWAVVMGNQASEEANADGASSQKVDPSLSTSLQVAKFLVEKEQKLNVTQLRSLCKFLGNRDIRLEDHGKRKLGKLKDLVEELSFIDDSTSLKSLRPLTELLSSVRGYEDSEDEEEDEENGQYSDDETVSENSLQENLETVGETTIEDEIMMNSIARLSLENKENPPSVIKAKGRRSSAQSNISELEPLGTLNL